jgi:hypothetical protein
MSTVAGEALYGMTCHALFEHKLATVGWNGPSRLMPQLPTVRSAGAVRCWELFSLFAAGFRWRLREAIGDLGGARLAG